MGDHYDDGKYYDQAYRRRRHDVRFYANLCEDRGGPVLELGCGTGRVSAAIAKRGVNVIGVDTSAPMLARAKEQRGKLSKARQALWTIKRGDIRRVRLQQTFPLVIAPFNVFMHLYTRTDVEQALSTVRAHLKPRGLFVFDVLLPCPSALARDPARGYYAGKVRHPKDGLDYRYTEYFDYDHASQIQSVVMDFEHPTHNRKSFCTMLKQRQFFPAELEALLHYNGFKITKHVGGFDLEPIDGDSESQLLFCGLR